MAPPRLVIVDPAHSGSVGHHQEVNRTLLSTFRQAGWQAELWADVALEADPQAPGPLRGVFTGCGYVDPRQWTDLGGLVLLARRVEQQLQLAASSGAPVRAWLGHSLLPYQLLGFARHLAAAPPATVLLSLMFPPEETLASASLGPVEAATATANCRVALAALARAVEQAGHQLQLAVPSRQQEQLFQPLFEATGLQSLGVHPAVVGAGCRPEPPAAEAPPLVLLHWGDLKPGKGRAAALALLERMLRQGVPPELAGWGWLFHSHGHEPLPEAERSLLQRAAASSLGLHWLEGPQSGDTMVDLLARCPLALLAYDPSHYRQRSSGMLWQWAAARRAVGATAAAVGPPSGWLALEAPQLGIGWSSPPPQGDWLEALCLSAARWRAEAATAMPSPWTAYGEQVLDLGFAPWCLQRLASAGSASQATGP